MTTSLEVILPYDYPWLHTIKLAFNNSNLNQYTTNFQLPSITYNYTNSPPYLTSYLTNFNVSQVTTT